VNRLRLIPYYTNRKSLEETLKDRRAINLLWLEILFNDSIDWEGYLDIKEIREAYEKACIWYCNFKTLIEAHIKRKPLKRIYGNIDSREYRRFIEVLNFVSP